MTTKGEEVKERDMTRGWSETRDIVGESENETKTVMDGAESQIATDHLIVTGQTVESGTKTKVKRIIDVSENLREIGSTLR